MKNFVRVLGAGIMLVDLVVFGLEHILPLLAKPPVPQVWSVTEVTGHLIFLFIGYLLLDHSRALAAYNVVKDKIPFLNRGAQ